MNKVWIYNHSDFSGMVIRFETGNGKHNAIYINPLTNWCHRNPGVPNSSIEPNATDFTFNFKIWFNKCTPEWKSRILATNMVPNEHNPDYVPAKEAKDYPVQVVPFLSIACHNEEFGLFKNDVVLMQDRDGEKYIFDTNNERWQIFNSGTYGGISVLINTMNTPNISNLIRIAETAPTNR